MKAAAKRGGAGRRGKAYREGELAGKLSVLEEMLAIIKSALDGFKDPPAFDTQQYPARARKAASIYKRGHEKTGPAAIGKALAKIARQGK